jgi:hypothetical protein
MPSEGRFTAPSDKCLLHAIMVSSGSGLMCHGSSKTQRLRLQAQLLACTLCSSSSSSILHAAGLAAVPCAIMAPGSAVVSGSDRMQHGTCSSVCFFASLVGPGSLHLCFLAALVSTAQQDS